MAALVIQSVGDHGHAVEKRSSNERSAQSGRPPPRAYSASGAVTLGRSPVTANNSLYCSAISANFREMSNWL